MPAIVMHEGFKNGFQWIGFAFSELRCEDSVAGVAEPELNGLVFFVALPFSRDLCAVAIEAALGLGANKRHSWSSWFSVCVACAACVCLCVVGSRWHGGEVA